jgi:cysteine desulfurase / selenocysteine lyase
MLAMAGHKSLLGPMGTGALYVRPGIELQPFREGGTGGDSITPTQPMIWPTRMEAGTPNTFGLAGLHEGIKFLQETGVERIQKHERALADRLHDKIVGTPGIRLFGGDRKDRLGIVCLSIEDQSIEETGNILADKYLVGARAGLHCAPYIHRAMGSFPEGLVRLSPGWFTTEAEIDAVAAGLIEIAKER